MPDRDFDIRREQLIPGRPRMIQGFRRIERHRGEVQSISLAAVNVNDAQLASRTRVTVIVKVKFEDVKAQKTLWENPGLTFSDEYELANPSLGQDVSAFINNDRVAFDRLSTAFAKSVVSAILEAF